MNLKALFYLSYGLYLVGSGKEDRLNGQIANTVFQVTSVPANFAVAINKKNYTHELITNSKVLTISVLSRDTPLNFVGNFGFKSGRDIDKLRGVNYKLGETGAPIVLDNTLAYIEGKIINQLDAGTHTLFLTQLVDSVIIRDGEPMTYAYYRNIKRGTTPKTAPSYIEEEKEAPKAAKYRCKICGYVYDPELGDPDGSIKPGTPFEEIPDDWVCPVCGAAKSEFERME